MKTTAAVFFSTLLLASSVFAGDAELIATLKSKGAAATETKSVVTGLSFADCSKLTAADYALIAQLTGVKQLSFGKGFDDTALKAIGAATTIENLSTNGMDVSDQGIKLLATWKALKSFAIFHPSKRLTGTGLAALSQVEKLTVAGSQEFGDDGMAAVATLTQLKGFRTWHSGVTPAGVQKLAALKKLTSVYLGQRLSMTPPVTLSDAALPVIAELNNLEDITLSEAPLSLSALSQLKKLAHLKRLTLDGIDIPEADIASLKQALPKADVRWTKPNDANKKRIDALFKK